MKAETLPAHEGDEEVYWLVLFTPGVAQSNARIEAAHEDFIDSLIRSNVVLLGGVLLPRNHFRAGYLLSCETGEQAEELVASDPYVRTGVFLPEIRQWGLVAINPEAIDQDLVIRPTDLQ